MFRGKGRGVKRTISYDFARGIRLGAPGRRQWAAAEGAAVGWGGLTLVSSARGFRNCPMILMSDSRETIAAIAGHLRCSPQTVRRIRKLYRMGGVEALQRWCS